MNLLVVGNGFDLAHGLPTQYSDFLYFMGLCITNLNLYPNAQKGYHDNEMNKITDLYCVQSCIDKVKSIPNNAEKLKIIESLLTNNLDLIDSASGLVESIKSNTWLRYFFFSYNQLLIRGVNWIDLETELADLLYLIDNSSNNSKEFVAQIKNGYWLTNYPTLSTINPINILDKMKKTTRYLHLIENTTLANKFNLNISNKAEIDLQSIYSNNTLFNNFTKSVFSYLYSELKTFSYLLSFYLRLVDTLQTNNKYDFSTPPFDIDCLLSFNYTNTFFRTYVNLSNVDFVNGNLEKNNAILGIENRYHNKLNHYCDNGMYNFFKYYQRINENIVLDYHNWIINPMRFQFGIDPMPQSLITSTSRKSIVSQKSVNVFVFGHSLDISDKQILSEIILSANQVIIFYYNEDDANQKKLNLLKILGEDQFIKSVNNYTANPMIFFSSLSSIEKH